MAENYTAESALAKAGVEADHTNVMEFVTNGRTPEALSNHEVAGEYVLFGIVPKDGMTLNGGQTMDYSGLLISAADIISDLNDELRDKTPSRALQFSIYVLYTMEPESRSVKSGTNTKDKIWKCKFVYSDGTKSSTKIIVVATHKNTESKPMVASKSLLVLSVKQATLLAMHCFKNYVAYSFKLIPNRVLLTPLAGAVYTAADIKFMSLIKNTTYLDMLHKANASCCNGGHVLPDSDASMALAAVASNTSKLAAKGKNDVRISLLHKSARQYNATMGKEFSERDNYIYCAFSQEGFPKT